MTNDNTRTKANAVFFSVLMVLSMVAVGFAAAPAAAVDSGSLTFNDQFTDSSDQVDVSVSSYNDTADSNASIAVTYEASNGSTILAGTNTSTNINGSGVNSGVVNVTLGNTGGLPGTHTAHLFNESYLSSAGLSAGDTVNSTVAGTAFTTANAFVSPNGASTRTAGQDVVYNETTVYQGEDDLTFVADDGSTVSAGALQKTAGDTQGTALSLPIGQNTATGTYASSSGFEVIVQEPRITTAEVVIAGTTNDVSQVNPGTNIEINADWNFQEAENLDLTVEDASETDITNQVVDAGNQTLSSSGQVGLDLSDEDAGDYTIIFEGSDDLDYGGVAEEYTITKTNDDTVSLDIAQDSATQGDNVDFTVSGGTDGETYLAVIESGDYASGVSNGSNAANVFRNVGDTNSVGNHVDSGSGTNYSYAEVEIDGTQAAGQIETQYVDDSSISVDLYDLSGFSVAEDLGNYSDSVDDDSLDVSEGSITLDSPSGTYTVGEEVDVNGTAQSADNVRLYAQNNGEWKVVEVDSSGNKNINVESDDTFEVEDVVLSEYGGNGNDILSFAGNYRIGVIDASEAATLGDSISTSDWTSASSTRSSITVTEGDLSGEFLTYNGQVAEPDDAVDVEGAAIGQNDVLIVFVGERGQTEQHKISVDSDGTFDESDLSVSNLDQGTASAHIISLGRDGVYGSSDAGDIDDLRKNISNIGSSSSLSGAQVRDRIVALTTDADASDDLMVSQTFRLNDGQVSINSVAPEGSDAAGINPVATGDSMVVTGTTNRQADDNSIVVSVYDADGNSVESADTDEWGTDGQYSVTISTADIETGTYSVEADTGTNTDRAEIEIVESVEEEQAQEEQTQEDTSEEQTQEDTSEDTSSEDTSSEDTSSEDTSSEDTSSEDTSSEEESTDDSTPGFGALVALVALVAAALLATRRRDE